MDGDGVGRRAMRSDLSDLSSVWRSVSDCAWIEACFSSICDSWVSAKTVIRGSTITHPRKTLEHLVDLLANALRPVLAPTLPLAHLDDRRANLDEIGLDRRTLLLERLGERVRRGLEVLEQVGSLVVLGLECFLRRLEVRLVRWLEVRQEEFLEGEKI